jgi:HK97 family phage major capsid protein
MDPELKKELDALKASIGKNVEALARLEKIEAAAQKSDADVKVLRADLDAVKASHEERAAAIRDLQRQGLVQRVEASPTQERRKAMQFLGAIARVELARAQGVAVPERFRAPEESLLREYREQVLARTTLAFNAATGSYLVPTVLETTPIDTLEEVGDLLNFVEFVPGLPAAGTISIPTITGEPTLSFSRASSDTAMSQTDATFGLLSLTPKEAYIYFPVDNNLLEMSALGLGSLLLNLINRAVVRGIVKVAIKGDGTSAYGSMTGILNQAAGYCISLSSGKKSFADLSYLEAVRIKKAVLMRARNRGRWLLATDVEGACGEENRTGKAPFLTYDPDGSTRLLRSPVLNDELMPDLSADAADTAFGAFGDLATMIVGMVGGVRIASDSSYRFGYNQTAFRAVVMMDIGRKPVSTLVTVKSAA